MKVKSQSEVAQSCLTLSNPWTGAYQAPPSMGFSRQEYWSGGPLLELRAHANPALFNLITSVNALFPIKVIFKELRSYDFNISF